MAVQEIFTADKGYSQIDRFVEKHGIKKILLVCSGSYYKLDISDYFSRLNEQAEIKTVFFTDFKPNPLFESVVKGIEAFRRENCDAVFAVGGGSAMDVAKCIKLFAYENTDVGLNDLKMSDNDIKLLTVPTTAGSGSEATRYAVIYYNGNKQSVTHDSIIPSAVFLDPSVLDTLPIYQKRSAMLDALCHAVEAYWSVNSTDESKRYSRKAIRLILDNCDAYLYGNAESFPAMLEAAFTAGKAINITQTTAGHAMCYKLTGLYGIAHGHAAALCVSSLWRYMLENTDRCTDSRGEAYLKGVFSEIAEAMGCMAAQESVDIFDAILRKSELSAPVMNDKNDYKILAESVNTVRLSNNPVRIDKAAIDEIYHNIFKEYAN